MNKIKFLKEYFTERFGAPLQRIPVDLGLSCPNREAGEGCAFCDASGSRARHLTENMPLEEQVARGIEYVRTRYRSGPPYAAYFQAFTSTNAAPERLKELYERVLKLADFKAVIISTRPDCLPGAVIDVIAELKDRYEVWVELGVQTASDRTLKAINRGHDFAAVESAVKRLDQKGILVAAHVILGLPGEEAADCLYTAEKIAALPFRAVKIHNLLILRGTRMEQFYHSGKVVPLGEYEYANLLAEFLRKLPEGMIVMRLCSDAPEENIVAPHWWMRKGAFTDMFLRMFESGGSSPDCLKAVRTDDGSYTFYHPGYRQHFHSTAGAWEESNRKYLIPCGVADRLKRGRNASILDVGFGMGFNVCAAAELAEHTGCASKLFITTLEFDSTAIDAATRLPERRRPDVVAAIAEHSCYDSENVHAEIVRGDARTSVSYLVNHFDYIFLDAFTPDSNPELWTYEFIGKLKSLLKSDGLLATYCSAYPVRGALLKLGFHLYESKPFGRKRGGTVAALDALPCLPPLPEKEIRIATLSTAGVPYRDPLLRWNRDEIRKNRAERVAELRASGMPKWYKGD